MQKRILASLLAALLLCSACQKDVPVTPSATTDTEADTKSAEVETETESTETYLPDDLPDGLDFGGASYTIFARSELDWGREMCVEELNGEIINDAIFNRNQSVNERLNVVIGQEIAPGVWGNEVSFNDTIRQMVMAGDNTYQLVAGYAYYITALAKDGTFMNLLNVPYIDFEKPWWNSDLRDELTVYNQLYFACGDLSWSMISSAFCLFFNKDFAAKYELPDLYETVLSNAWTYDAMYDMVASVAVDLNGDGVMNEYDQYGLTMPKGTNDDMLFAAFDQPLTAWDESGNMQILLGSEKAENIAEKLIALIDNNGGAFCGQQSGDNIDHKPFLDGHALFASSTLSFVTGTLRDTNIAYGIIPFPKYDEFQKKYQTLASDAYSLFCVPATAGDPELIGAVTEALGSESYRTVTPAYFETALKAKYSKDEASSQMLDLIRDGLMFNFGFVNSSSCENMVQILREVAFSHKTLTTLYAARGKKYANALDKLLTAYRELGERAQ